MKYVSEAKQSARKYYKGATACAGKDAKYISIGWCLGGKWSLQASISADKQVYCGQFGNPGFIKEVREDAHKKTSVF